MNQKNELSKKAEVILSKLNCYESFNDSRKYYYIGFLSVVFFVYGFIGNYNPLTLDGILQRLVETVIASMPFFIIIFIHNEVKKSLSIRSIHLMINHLVVKSWNWHSIPHVYNPASFHPYMLCHPVTLFLFGQYFLHHDLRKEGEQLVMISLKKNSKLQSIVADQFLKETDALILIDLLSSEKKFSRYYLFVELWSNKFFRITVIVFISTILILRFVSQIF